MKLSLSGRLVESGSETVIPVGEFLDLAGRYGYDAVDLRASQLNPQTSAQELDSIRAGLEANGLELFEGAYRGKFDGSDDEAFSAFAGVIAGLGGEGIRVGGALPVLKKAAQLAAPHGIKILYQMHTGGPFETVANAAATIAEISEPNFGIMPEPANLVMGRETFNEDMFEPLRGKIFGVHVQTLAVSSDAANALKLADGTEVRYDRVPYDENKQTDFATFFAALKKAGFDGYVNELEPRPPVEELEDTVRLAAEFLGRLIQQAEVDVFFE